MRRVLLLLLVGTTSLVVGGSAAGVERGARPQRLARGISLRVPSGWHVVHGWLSDVIDPVPVLAVASFDVRLSRHTCECGTPNVAHFPRGGAFLFMWEYPNYPRRALAHIPPRPVRFRLARGAGQPYMCHGPNDDFSFRDRGRVFQAEIYFGAAAGQKVRAQLRDLMDSLRFSAA